MKYFANSPMLLFKKPYFSHVRMLRCSCRPLRFFIHASALVIIMTHVLLLNGCSNSDGSGLSVGLEGETATPYHITYDAQVEVTPVRVYVHPNVTPLEPLRGLFVPLRITQDITKSKTMSRHISRTLWQVWLSQQAFAALEYDDRTVPYNVNDALAQARQRGANVLVGGYITHYIDGGTSGDSVVSMQIEMYEVATGNLIWSMGQGGRLEKQQAQDYFLVGAQARMPADPVNLTARSLAYDMGKKIVDWVKPMRLQPGTPEGQTF